MTEIIASLESNPVKGECLLIVEGAKEQASESLDLEKALEKLQEKVAQGVRLKTASQEIARETGLQAKELYKAYHLAQEKDEETDD